MKRIFKNSIFTFILGGVCFASITAFALSVHSNQVVYTPNNPNFKVENVEEALDELYAKMRNATIGKATVRAGLENVSSTTARNFKSNQDYVCVFTMRGLPSLQNATNADVIISDRHTSFLDGNYSAYFLYFKALSSTITFNFNGARGIDMICYPVLRDE